MFSVRVRTCAPAKKKEGIMRYKKDVSGLPITARLPATLAEFDKTLRVDSVYTLNDRVHDYIREMYETPDFKKYLDTRTNKEAITGHLVLDEGEVASRIRAKANEKGDDIVGTAKPFDVVKAVRVVHARSVVVLLNLLAQRHPRRLSN
jgi:hypothetical protein